MGPFGCTLGSKMKSGGPESIQLSSLFPSLIILKACVPLSGEIGGPDHNPPVVSGEGIVAAGGTGRRADGRVPGMGSWTSWVVGSVRAEQKVVQPLVQSKNSSHLHRGVARGCWTPCTGGCRFWELVCSHRGVDSSRQTGFQVEE